MRLLVLGGTWFLGRAVVEEGLRARHAVTVFNRGRFGSPSARAAAVHGDRTSPEDLVRLAGTGPYDTVIDVPGVIPAQVRDAARALRPVAARYVFVSSVSAYRDWPAQPVSEDSPLHYGDPDADPGEWAWGTGVYGPLKAGAEAAVRREYSDDLVTICFVGVPAGCENVPAPVGG